MSNDGFYGTMWRALVITLVFFACSMLLTEEVIRVIRFLDAFPIRIHLVLGTEGPFR